MPKGKRERASVRFHKALRFVLTKDGWFAKVICSVTLLHFILAEHDAKSAAVYTQSFLAGLLRYARHPACNNNNKTYTAHVSTLMGDQGAVKTKTNKTKTKNRHYKISP